MQGSCCPSTLGLRNVQTCSASECKTNLSKEAKGGGSLSWGQLGLQREFQVARATQRNLIWKSQKQNRKTQINEWLTADFLAPTAVCVLPAFLGGVARRHVGSTLKGSFSTARTHCTAATASLWGCSDRRHVQLSWKGIKQHFYYLGNRTHTTTSFRTSHTMKNFSCFLA